MSRLDETLGISSLDQLAAYGQHGVQRILGKQIAQILKFAKIDDVSPEQITAVISGDEDELVNLFSQCLGLHPKICKALISIIKLNKPEMLDSFADLATEFNTDP